jgi:hypothetical protein
MRASDDLPEALGPMDAETAAGLEDEVGILHNKLLPARRGAACHLDGKRRNRGGQR